MNENFPDFSSEFQDDSGEVGNVRDAGSHQMVNVGTSTSRIPTNNNVLNRVSSQQDKWKKQVLEQRRNIYDRHTMLN